MSSRIKIGDYEIERAGSVWKVRYHGTWFATRNSFEEAEALVRSVYSN